MTGYKIVLEEKNQNLFHEIAIVADNEQEAIALARESVGDREATRTVLYDMKKVIKGVIVIKKSLLASM